jgi:hypothetical protein
MPGDLNEDGRILSSGSPKRGKGRRHGLSKDGRSLERPLARPSSGPSGHPRVFARGQALLPEGEGIARHLLSHGSVRAGQPAFFSA